MSKSREQLRKILASDECSSVAPVFSALSARIAELAGWNICKISGSVGKWAELGLPDAVSMTNISDLSDICRRVTRVIDIPLVMDADDGLRGSAPLTIRRTVRELEQAGAAAIELEDNLVPEHFFAHDPNADLRSPGRHASMISVADQVAKLRAAVEAREDASLVLVAKTPAIYELPLDEALARIKAYSSTGVDAIWPFMFPFGRNGKYERHYPGADPADPRADIEAIRSVTDLPIITSGLPSDLVADEGWLSANHVRLRYLSQAPYRSAVKAIYESLVALLEGADGDSIPDGFPGDVHRAVFREAELREWDKAAAAS